MQPLAVLCLNPNKSDSIYWLSITNHDNRDYNVVYTVIEDYYKNYVGFISDMYELDEDDEDLY